MLRESEFLGQLRRLLGSRVHGLSEAEKRTIVVRLTDELGETVSETRPPSCWVIPFVTGRRPRDEATHPGLGSSANAAMILPGSNDGNLTHVLYEVDHGAELPADALRGLALDVTLSFTGPGTGGAPLPGWYRRPLEPAVFDADGGALRTLPIQDATNRTLVLALAPADVLLPGDGWAWEQADPTLRAAATDHADPFTFGHLFLQELRVEIRLTRDGIPIAACYAVIDVCDARRSGSLYQRVLERVVVPDTERQRHKARLAQLDVAHHPWFPVLTIGSDKADLYTRALVGDIVQGKRNLTDPRWLLRVGLYLEFLTCLGIFEAVRDDVGDLLTPAERAAFETSPVFAPLRAAVNVPGWREVWAQRDIALSIDRGSLGGPSLRNLMVKRSATLAFLHVHHEDLKHAIALAGANEHNAQETWHRVFRDAERAVLRKTETAFPELAQLHGKVREFVLWHRKGRLDALGLRWVPEQMTGLLGDQDGLYASACSQYRASMNEVAEWAKRKALMDHTGRRVRAARRQPAAGLHGGPDGTHPTPAASRRLRRVAPRRGRSAAGAAGLARADHRAPRCLAALRPPHRRGTLQSGGARPAARPRAGRAHHRAGAGGLVTVRAGRRRARGPAATARRYRPAGGHARSRRRLRRDVAADRRAAQQHRALHRRGRRLRDRQGRLPACGRGPSRHSRRPGSAHGAAPACERAARRGARGAATGDGPVASHSRLSLRSVGQNDRGSAGRLGRGGRPDRAARLLYAARCLALTRARF